MKQKHCCGAANSMIWPKAEHRQSQIVCDLLISFFMSVLDFCSKSACSLCRVAVVMTSGLHKRLCLTFDVRHDEHLRLGKPLLEVVEVDGAVKGDEAYLCSRVSRKPMRHTHTFSRAIPDNTAQHFLTNGWKCMKCILQLSLKQNTPWFT